MAISDEELVRLAATDKDEIGQAICAFANDLPGRDRPGVLLIGVHDDGRPSGLDVTDRVLQSLADFRDQGSIVPLPVMTIERRSLNGADVVVVEVQPSHLPPVRYKGQVWIRVGPRRALASVGDERVLSERRRHLDLPYDARPVVAATLADLDEIVFLREYLPAAIDPDILAENGRTVRERLASLHFATPEGADRSRHAGAGR